MSREINDVTKELARVEDAFSHEKKAMERNYREEYDKLEGSIDNLRQKHS